MDSIFVNLVLIVKTDQHDFQEEFSRVCFLFSQSLCLIANAWEKRVIEG